jgi:hypothetical protein
MTRRKTTKTTEPSRGGADGGVRNAIMQCALPLALFVPLAVATPGAEAMTKDELLALLKKTGAPETSLVEEFPATIEERSFDFLGGGTYLRVMLSQPDHPVVLNFVWQDGKLVRLPRTAQELAELDRRINVSIKSADMALRYARWALDASRGGAFWLVSSVEDVPFLPAAPDEQDLAAEVSKARSDLAAKIHPPSVKEEQATFEVTQFAVEGRDLVRYTINVSRLGHLRLEEQTVSAGIPVVYVR